MGLFNLFKKQKQMSNFDSQFFLGKKLGEGAFATVHEAIRKQDSQKFAVKILQKTKIKDGSIFNSVDAIINEIDILRRIHHKNIVALENIYNTDEHYYLVMYLATGLLF
jgi:serine/threonine protein kinase